MSITLGNNTLVCANGESPPCTSIDDACTAIGIVPQAMGYNEKTASSSSLG